ncbi:putative RNA methyltransferase [Paenibacillus humicus]|uniref:putative RNA methyltransferase n=1 Tax=Paenibacillus humicus TaxID=412861 RepID=UPI003D288AAB
MLIFHTIPAGTVICPVCSGPLELQDNSLICGNRHCFDIAKQGYVNFLLQAPKEKYDKRLFQSRARVSQAEVFRGLTDQLGEIVRNELERKDLKWRESRSHELKKQGLQQRERQQQELQRQELQQRERQQQELQQRERQQQELQQRERQQQELQQHQLQRQAAMQQELQNTVLERQARQRGERVQQKVMRPSLGQSPGERQRTAAAILDAGCGEGSHLSALVRHLAGTSGCKLVAAGIDISKAGIQLAAKANPGMLWGVADLAKCPFANGSFGIILNILSPANYSEFHRMLADDGLVIKVIPGTEYLQEIRRALHSETARRTYSNDRTIELFRRHFELVDMQQVKYELLIEQKDLADLLQMTPLAWQAGEEQLRLMQAMNKQPVITFDFVILIGRKRYKR